MPKFTLKKSPKGRSEKFGGRQKQPRVPYHYKPEELSYEEWQIALRRQFAMEQHYSVKNIGDHPVYSDFEVASGGAGKRPYKVALRSEVAGANFCSCPDFAVNTLGTCKHIEYVVQQLKKKKNMAKMFKDAYIQPYSSIFLQYGKERKIVFKIGTRNAEELHKLAVDFFDGAPEKQQSPYILRNEAIDHFEIFMEKALALDPDLRCYKDALDFIVDKRDARKRSLHIDQKYPDGKESIGLSGLMKIELHPYQKEAVLFAAKAGRCIIADDMGLGKTLEAIAATELMAREFGVEKVLIICPTSLKYQWKGEIERFSGRSTLVIEGLPAQRKQQYGQPEFFKIVTYDAVRNDLEAIQKMAPDLVILDEAQRIKNWKTKTAQTSKQVRSTYAMVLTGTPLENRLEELHSITEFIDRFRLGPLFRFLANHQIVNQSGKIIGYKDLHSVAETIAPILIRRTKKEVMQQLPSRTDKNCYVPVTPQQKEIHEEHREQVAKLVAKWRRYKFLSEKERQFLLIHLNSMRMVSDSTYILDQKTRHDTKIDELMALLDEVFETGGKKVVIFSQWERMTRLIAQEFDRRKIGYEYLHGGIPSAKRKDLFTNFHNNPLSKVFLSTDAGSVGLNLQCASFLINMDCPWNPAVLEQRIARIHRFGQKEPINVVNFISTGTIEEVILETLRFKKSVFEGVLDNGADEVFMGESKFQQFMKGIETIVPGNESVVAQTGTEAEVHLTGGESSQAGVNADAGVSADTDANAQSRTGAHADAQLNLGTTPSAPEKSEQAAAANPTLETLFTAGLNFLEQLAQNLNDGADKNRIHQGTSPNSASSHGEKTPASALQSIIEKDEKTGKKTLKIPMPSEEVLNKAMTVLEAFAKAMKK